MSRPLVIYLDQNKWVELLKAESENSEGSLLSGVLADLREAVAAGQVVIPLSSSHYLETWHRSDPRSRNALAAMMRELSNFVTIFPAHHLLCLEVESFLLNGYRWKGCSCAPPDIGSMVLGWGVNHAFHSSTGRFRFVESLAAEERPEGDRAVVPAAVLELFRRVGLERNERYEWWSLAGDDAVLRHSGVEVRPEHRLGTELQQEEEELAGLLSRDAYLRSRLDDYLVLQETTRIVDVVNKIGFWHAAGTGTMMDEWQAAGPGFGRDIIESLPTRTCLFHLRRAKHANPQWKWAQHDRTDLLALSAAVPYCDVVVTERQWGHVLRTAKLDRRFGTKLISKLTDLPALLAGAA